MFKDCKALWKILDENADKDNNNEYIEKSEISQIEKIIEFKDNKPPFGLHDSNSYLDEAYLKFKEVLNLTVRYAEIENSIYKLAKVIKKTKKRANALKNSIIPKFSHAVKFIGNALEEKEREEFSRLKVIKNFRNFKRS